MHRLILEWLGGKQTVIRIVPFKAAWLVLLGFGDDVADHKRIVLMLLRIVVV